MKKYLNLDPAFSPFGKSIPFESFVFNGGEPHIRITDKNLANHEVVITSRIRSFADVGLMLIAVDALRRIGVQSISMVLPYFPAARQDRVMTIGEPLTVKVYANIINGLNLNSITILDPHSDVTPALLNNVVVVSNHSFGKIALEDLEDFYLISPDAGASKKVHNLSHALGNVDVIQCNKKRDPETGQLSGFQVFSKNLEGRTCVVVDDICDGGGTFLGLAKELKKHNAGRLILVVTHGIFSQGLEELSCLYDSIICTDSFSTIQHPSLKQIKLSTNTLKH